MSSSSAPRPTVIETGTMGDCISAKRGSLIAGTGWSADLQEKSVCNCANIGASRERKSTVKDVSQAGSFWSAFAHEQWEQSPVLFQKSVANDEDLFDALIGMTKVGRADRFWLAKNQKLRSRDDFKKISMERFGPRASDEGLNGFFKRAQRELLGKPFGINVHRLQLGNSKLWFRARHFIQGLNQILGGLPTQKWELDTFFGTYEATPFGIHQDNASVFSFGVLGRRRFCFWPHEYFASDDPALRTPDREKIEPHLPHATILDMEPGDLVYWPSSHWHVVLSDGEPSATVQVSAYFGTSLSESMGQTVERILRPQLRVNEPAMFPLAGNSLPSNLADARGALGELISDGSLDHQLQKAWLKRSTADGFVAAPPMKPESNLSEDAQLKLAIPGCLAWIPTPDGALDVIANGLRFEQPNAPEVLRVLEGLVNGETGSFAMNRAATSKTIRNLVQMLDRCRVFATNERRRG